MQQGNDNNNNKSSDNSKTKSSSSVPSILVTSPSSQRVQQPVASTSTSTSASISTIPISSNAGPSSSTSSPAQGTKRRRLNSPSPTRITRARTRSQSPRLESQGDVNTTNNNDANNNNNNNIDNNNANNNDVNLDSSNPFPDFSPIRSHHDHQLLPSLDPNNPFSIPGIHDSHHDHVHDHDHDDSHPFHHPPLHHHHHHDPHSNDINSLNLDLNHHLPPISDADLDEAEQFASLLAETEAEGRREKEEERRREREGELEREVRKQAERERLEREELDGQEDGREQGEMDKQVEGDEDGDDQTKGGEEIVPMETEGVSDIPEDDPMNGTSSHQQPSQTEVVTEADPVNDSGLGAGTESDVPGHDVGGDGNGEGTIPRDETIQAEGESGSASGSAVGGENSDSGGVGGIGGAGGLNIDEMDNAQLELFVAQFAESQRQAAELEEQQQEREQQAQAQLDEQSQSMVQEQEEQVPLQTQNQARSQPLSEGRRPAENDRVEEPVQIQPRAPVQAQSLPGPVSGSGEGHETGGKGKGSGDETRGGDQMDVSAMEKSDTGRKEAAPGATTSTAIGDGTRDKTSLPTITASAGSSRPSGSTDLHSAAAAALSALDPNAQASILAALQQINARAQGARDAQAQAKAGEKNIDGNGKEGNGAGSSGERRGDDDETVAAYPPTTPGGSRSGSKSVQPQSRSGNVAGGPLLPGNRGNTPPASSTGSNLPSHNRLDKGKSRAPIPNTDDEEDNRDSDDEELIRLASGHGRGPGGGVKRGDSEDLNLINGETARERMERRKRNRLVLSCTECHRRKQQCDRNIPCARCIKRKVPHLCRMEMPPAPSQLGKRKREDDFSDLTNNEELLARLAALEQIFRSQNAQNVATNFLQNGSRYGDGRPGLRFGGGPQANPVPLLGGGSAVVPGPMDIDGNDDIGAANISAGLAALVAATAEAEQDKRDGEQGEDGEQADDGTGQNAEAAALLAQIAQSLQKVQPTQAQEPEEPEPAPAPVDTQGGLLMSVLSQLTGPNKAQPATFLNGLLASTAPLVKLPGVWADIPSALPETSAQCTYAFASDSSAKKINLGMIGFREDDGKIFVPPTTRQIERTFYMRGGLTHEALPIEGFGPFLGYGLRFAYGKESAVYKQGRIAGVQTLSLTGALRLGATFLSRHPSHPPLKSIYIPTPTVEEDAWALKDAGLEIRLYRFYDKKTGLVDWEGMNEDLHNAPDASIVLLHVGGSSPTGAELTAPQWRLLTELVKRKKHIIFAVMEFQGLATGDPDKDAQPLRLLAHENVPLVLAQNFDASMGLYSDSPTLLSVVANSVDARYRIESQLRSMSRAMHGHPTPWGANVAAGILGNAEMCKNWLSEVRAMSQRLRSIREKLYDQLANKLKTPGHWQHMRKSAGMYCSILLTQEQLQLLAAREHIHLLPDGCFSLGCLNAAKIETFCRGVDRVVRWPAGYEVPEEEEEEEVVEEAQEAVEEGDKQKEKQGTVDAPGDAKEKESQSEQQEVRPPTNTGITTSTVSPATTANAASKVVETTTAQADSSEIPIGQVAGSANAQASSTIAGTRPASDQPEGGDDTMDVDGEGDRPNDVTTTTATTAQTATSPPIAIEAEQGKGSDEMDVDPFHGGDAPADHTAEFVASDTGAGGVTQEQEQKDDEMQGGENNNDDDDDDDIVNGEDMERAAVEIERALQEQIEAAAAAVG